MANKIYSPEIEKGDLIKIEGEIFEVLEKEFFKPGKGMPVIRTKLRNYLTDKIIERNFRNNETVEIVELELEQASFLYQDRKSAVFLLKKNNQRLSLPLEMVKEKIVYLTPEIECEIVFYEEKPIALKIPIKVSLKVVEAPPAVKGNTVTSATKTVTVETGLKINVPIFIKEGDKIVINTLSGEYCGRE
ncbi:MAG: elongation factor P [Candidatus Paceibacterota bacterium]